MRNTVLLLGLMLTGTVVPERAVCWIDPMTGRPYLAKCEKAKKPPRTPAPDKTRNVPEQPVVDASKKGE